MRRPWYSYLLLFAGGLALLGALFRPMVGALSTSPGALVGPRNEVVFVRPGGPLERAGVRIGDRFLKAERIQPGGTPRELRWVHGLPVSGNLVVDRNGQSLTLTVNPAPPARPVGLLWWLVGVLNVGLAALALALFWQRPADGRATLLGLVLLTAPVFAFPREPRLLALALSAHFFAVFPTGWPRRPRLRATLLYLPFLFFGFIGAGWWEAGKVQDATGLFNLVALGYAGYGLARVLSRWRGAAPEERPVIRTLTLAAAAIFGAVVLGLFRDIWVVSDQFIPANLLPAALFSAAVAHLVFRLRALEVRVMARRTLQYLLARWTLGTLFLIPGFLLVWRLGQLSVSHQPARGEDVLGYLLWMFVTGLLLGKRQSVLRNLDRRFFRDAEARREALIRLAHELGDQTEAAAVLSALESGVRRALSPGFLRFSLPDVPFEPAAEVVAPVRRGETALGYLQLGPKEGSDPYTAEERQLLEAACVQAAVALENSRLSAALLARQREELAARTAGVLAGAEEERRRLAADLHDQVLPELRQIAGDLGRIRGHANGLAPELEQVEGEVRGTMDSVREVMEALRPSTLDMLGLGDALESYLRKSAARRDPPLSVAVRRSGEEPALTAEQSLALYRICQEAINNVLKHSGAARAGLELASDDDGLTVTIWDDGAGFDAEAALGRGHGLGNIRYRADLIGAEVRWAPREGGGTSFSVSLPLAVSVEG